MAITFPSLPVRDFHGDTLNFHKISRVWGYDDGVAVFNVKHPTFNARGDGVTDDSAAIQKAIDAAYAAGGGVVFIPAGTFICAVKIKPYVGIMGVGWGSILKPPSSGVTTTTIDSVNNAGADTTLDPKQNWLKDLRVQGINGSTLTTAVRFLSSNSDAYIAPGSGIDGDPGPVIYNVLCDEAYSGFVIGRNMRGAKLVSCRSHHCRKRGFDIRCTDSFVGHSEAGACGDGFIIEAPGEGFNNIVNCKSWYNVGTAGGGSYEGTGIGFFFGTNGNIAEDCEAQDNFNSGFVVDTAEEVRITGKSGGSLNQELYLTNATNCDIDLQTVWADTRLTTNLLKLSNTSTQNEVRITPPKAANRAGGFTFFTTSGGADIQQNTVSFGKVRAQVSNSALQAITSGGAGAAITFDTEATDSESTHSTSSNTSRLTAVRPGWYTISGHVRWEGDATGTIRRIVVLLNGATNIGAQSCPPPGASQLFQSVECKRWLNVNDYVELWAFNDVTPAANLDVQVASGNSPYFEFSCE